MTSHIIASQEEWLKARLPLLEAEKELTRQSDMIAERRQALPWVRVQKNYRFETDHGSCSLADLFGGRSQLLVYHFMFGPDYSAGCPSCSAIADGFNGVIPHLQNHDVAFWAVSRGPLEKLLAFRERMGWSFPWASSGGSTFNYDFSVSFTEDQQRYEGIEYNYRPEPPIGAPEKKAEQKPVADAGWAAEEVPVTHSSQAGTDLVTFIRERPGVSAFTLEDGQVYHTYSGFSRSVDGLWGMYQWLDRAPKGRNEPTNWLRHHDAYGRS